jgi:hypothetical protein
MNVQGQPAALARQRVPPPRPAGRAATPGADPSRNRAPLAPAPSTRSPAAPHRLAHLRDRRRAALLVASRLDDHQLAALRGAEGRATARAERQVARSLLGLIERDAVANVDFLISVRDDEAQPMHERMRAAVSIARLADLVLPRGGRGWRDAGDARASPCWSREYK